MNDFNKLKSLPRESLDNSFKRFNFIVTQISKVGTIYRNHKTNLQYVTGLGRQVTMEKMIVQGDRKIKNLSIYNIYHEIQALESTMIKDGMDLEEPLALFSLTTIN